MGLVAGLLALLGEFGHQALVQLQATAAHHLFHLVFPLLAVIVFSTYLGVYIRLDGWPTFSWRLRPAGKAGETAGFPHRPLSSRE